MTLAISGVHVGHGAKFVRVLCFCTFHVKAHDAHVASQYVTLNARLMQCLTRNHEDVGERLAAENGAQR
jgi:hypothetical protein